jgi:hypothetical protein
LQKPNGYRTIELVEGFIIMTAEDVRLGKEFVLESNPLLGFRRLYGDRLNIYFRGIHLECVPVYQLISHRRNDDEEPLRLVYIPSYLKVRVLDDIEQRLAFRC